MGSLRADLSNVVVSQYFDEAVPSEWSADGPELPALAVAVKLGEDHGPLTETLADSEISNRTISLPLASTARMKALFTAPNCWLRLMP